MRVAFDSRRVGEPHGVGRYARCLLTALRETAAPQAQIVETHRPRHVDVFHSPWIDGALLRSPCPMVEQVTQKPRLDHGDGSMSGARPATDTTPGRAAGQQGLVSP